MNPTTQSVKILCLYANEDLDIIRKLEKHLTVVNKNVDFSFLSDNDIDSEQKKIVANDAIKSSDIFLLAISIDFLTSKINTGGEMQKIIQQSEEQKSIVIPIIISSCDWMRFPYAKFQSLMFTKPIKDNRWNNVDDAIRKAVQGIEQVLPQINMQLIK